MTATESAGATAPRFELSWGRAAAKWVAITDRQTGVRVVGRDHTSWEAALARAVASLRQQMARRQPLS